MSRFPKGEGIQSALDNGTNTVIGTGGMRDATPEERESIGKYIKSISKPTGVNFWDLADGEYISRTAIEYINVPIAPIIQGEEVHYEWVAFRKQIEQLPSVAIPSAEPKWIPVSERLPEEGVDVLACFYTGEGNYKMMVSRRSDHNYWNGVGRTADMVAWMPLPKPYREDDEEE